MKSTRPTPAFSVMSGTPGFVPGTAAADPGSRRTVTSFAMNPKDAFEAFLTDAESVAFCTEIAEIIVEKASQQHLSNHYDGLAQDYTAHSTWAEMLAAVGQSFVSSDMGMPREIRPQKHKHLDASPAWKPDAAPTRIPSDETSRRVIAIRRHYEPPPPVREDDDDKLSKTSGGKSSFRSTKDKNNQRKSFSQSDNGLLATTQTSTSTTLPGSRPTSGGSSRNSTSSDIPLTVTATSVPRSVGALARKVMTNVNAVKGLGDLIKKQSTSEILIAVEGGGESHQQQPGKHGMKSETTPIGKSLASPGRPAPTMSLKQPEQGAATEDIEVQQHQQRTQAIHDLAEESARKAAKITKALADPKVSSKGFVVDGSGQVIPVINLEDGRNLPSQTIESPRFQLPSGAPPPAAVAQTDTKKRSNRVDIPPATTKSNAKTSSSPAKSKDEQFYTSDTTEIPMNIQFAPVGGVACKDQSGPVRRAELKIPASKMLRSEFTKLVNAFDATAATTVSLDDEGGPKDLLSKTAPPVLDKQGETRPGTERAGSVTARVPTVPRRLGDKTPNSARKPSTHGVGGTSPVRLPGTVSPELIPGSAYQIQHPALPPQKPKVTDPRQRPHFHAKPTHDSVATVTAQKTSSSWKETSSKVHAVGIDKVTVRYSIDEPNEGDA